jgi:hypothetical protein
LFDAAAMSAPQSFGEGIEQAATLMASAISDNITVNLRVHYDASFASGRAEAGPVDTHLLSYSTVRQDLIPAASALAGDSFVFRPDLGTNSTMVSASFNAPDSHGLLSGPLPEFSFSGPATASDMLIHQVNDSHDLFVNQDQPSPPLHVTDLHAGAVFIH